MTSEPVDKYFGIPLSEWIDRLPNELDVDAVGLWQIIPTGKDSFSLFGNNLDLFAKKCILGLINRGAVPVRPVSAQHGYWEKQLQYGDNPEEIADNIISEWKATKRDPDQNGIWFYIFKFQNIQ
jgi:hypothetical protein